MTNLTEIRDDWNKAARADAMFYILTSPGKENGGWGEDEFFARGQREIDGMLDWLRSEGYEPTMGRALDFGCGVGRLTRALATHFDRAEGVDISREMVRRARKLTPACPFHTHGESNLRLFDDATFDFIYSNITLQHMPHDYQRAYIAEFVRVLRPEGLAVFGLPVGPESRHADPWLSMYGADEASVTAWVNEAGGTLHTCQPNEHGEGAWSGRYYVVGP